MQHWCTVVPDPAMRVTLWALMGAGGNCHEYIQDTPPHLFLFCSALSQLVYVSGTTCLRSFWIRSLLRQFASLARAHSPRHIGERLILQFAASLDDLMNPSKEGQSWIPLWDMASIHASEATLAAMKAAFPPRRTVLHPATKHFVLAAL